MFIAAGMPAGMHTATILEQLKGLAESPWADLYGTGLHDRGLATMLGRYEVQSRSVRVGDASRKGYTIEDLWGRGPATWTPRSFPLEKGHKGHKGHSPSSTKIM